MVQNDTCGVSSRSACGWIVCVPTCIPWHSFCNDVRARQRVDGTTSRSVKSRAAKWISYCRLISRCSPVEASCLPCGNKPQVHARCTFLRVLPKSALVTKSLSLNSAKTVQPRLISMKLRGLLAHQAGATTTVLASSLRSNHDKPKPAK